MVILQEVDSDAKDCYKDAITYLIMKCTPLLLTRLGCNFFNI